MNKKERALAREEIARGIDIENERYSEKDLTTLLEIVRNRVKYDGTSKTYKNRYRGNSSEGKYIREEEETYTIRNSEDGVRVITDYKYKDDDGLQGGGKNVYSKGRDILKYIKQITD